MLQKLSIQNFALIDNLEMDFKEGFTIITGETGAGKSILLGGLSLILGKRADLSSLKNKDRKCIIEGEFSIQNYNLSNFFNENDIDIEEPTIVRREISVKGKSRAFINDTPVTLVLLNKLSDQLVDIHSQHETLQLADVQYQFKIIDVLAKNEDHVSSYQFSLENYQKHLTELDELVASQVAAKQQYDYNLYQLQELTDANLKEGEQESLEETLQKLNNIEAIKQHFAEALSLSQNEEIGLHTRIHSFKNHLLKLASFSQDYEKLAERVTSLEIEFNDIINELENENEHVDFSTADIEKYNNRLQLIYDLQKKHNVVTISEMLEKQKTLEVLVGHVENASDSIASKKVLIVEAERKLNELATTIHNRRIKVLPGLKNSLEMALKSLEMPNTRFDINLKTQDKFLSNGTDELEFLFSANKGVAFEPLKKVASGGEMSRIMLAVKGLLSQHTNLPTIIFDEIDTGVSGEVSNKMASIMKTMSANMQVISITHLPQIAAKGNHHFKVYKKEIDDKTITNVKQLNDDERVQELAEMLGGKQIADSAIEHAKQLLS